MGRSSLARAGIVALLALGTSGGVAAAATSVTYDSFSKPGGYTFADYYQKWSNPYGLLEADPSVRPEPRTFLGGRFSIAAVPFKVGADFSVFDHLKYIGVSNEVFPLPQSGSVTFSSNVSALTPGTRSNLTQHGVFGPPGTWTDPLSPPPSGFAPYSATVLEGQQAGVVMNMVDFCSGQLFDWFLSTTRAFALIERLPTNVTGNTSNPNCPGAEYVGRDLMYTQIVKEVRILPLVPHKIDIKVTRQNHTASVDYVIDGVKIASVDHVGIPLDKQGVPYTGTYPSLGPGEEVADQIGAFAIGHGLFSLLDAFPFQHPEAPELSVSIPVGNGNPATAGNARLFGQGAIGSFDDFVVTTAP